MYYVYIYIYIYIYISGSLLFYACFLNTSIMIRKVSEGEKFQQPLVLVYKSQSFTFSVRKH